MISIDTPNVANSIDRREVVDGECEGPGRIDIDELLKPQALEERICRHRCVEAWSMVASWAGLPLAEIRVAF